MQKLLEIGLSGWILFIATILISGGLGIRILSRRKTRQSNIVAGGDVAGGDIAKGRKGRTDKSTSSSEVDSVQKNIAARGDVAGGNIDKSNR